MTIISRLMFLLALFLPLLTNTSQMVFAKGNNNNNVREACSATRYQSLCVHSLAQFSNTAGRSPSKWARAGVSVSIGEVKNVQAYLEKLKRQGHMKGRNKVALSDCVETFAYALDELHKSLGVLRRLSKSTFSTQMGDLNTWISAALTDEDTCLDGFEGQNEKQIKLLQNRVQNVSYITSNALALVNKLATTGENSQDLQHLRAPNDGRVVSNLVAQALRKEPLTVYGDGKQTTSFQYVSDLVEGLMHLMEGEHVGPFNLGNPGEFTMLELAKVVQETIDPEAKIEYRSKELLGWEPKVDLRNGLPLMVSDFRQRIFEDQKEGSNLCLILNCMENGNWNLFYHIPQP